MTDRDHAPAQREAGARTWQATPPWYEDGRLHFAVGIEDTFIPQGFPGRRKLDEYELTQHYHLWHSDLSLAAAAGAEMVRWGIPWYLIEPSPGRFRWGWLDRVVDRFAELGLTCLVDLLHYGTPLWLDKQFLNTSYPARVAGYAAAVADRYRGRLSVWTPANEPLTNAIYCGERGIWPPALTGQDGFVKIVMQIARGIVETQRTIASVAPEATFVHVEASFRFVGEWFPFDLAMMLERRFLVLDLVTGRVDAGHQLRAYLLEQGAEEDALTWFAANAVRPDVIGVNYYPAFTSSRYEPGRGDSISVEAGTRGLDEVLREFAARYGRPVFLTETSRGGSVGARLAWLRESLELVDKLRTDDVPVVGYTWWPLFALVDWMYRESTEPVDRWLVQMGLYDLARDGSGVLRRLPTPVAGEFRRRSGNAAGAPTSRAGTEAQTEGR